MKSFGVLLNVCCTRIEFPEIYVAILDDRLYFCVFTVIFMK